MKANQINPFLNSTIKLFENMMGETPSAGEKYLQKHFGNHRWQISGVISLSGSVEGCVVFRLSKILAARLLLMSGVNYDKNDEKEVLTLINEMVGEMINVIAGNSLSALSQLNIDISIPFVVQGENHTISWPKETPIIVIPFITNHGPFEVCVSFKEIHR